MNIDIKREEIIKLNSGAIFLYEKLSDKLLCTLSYKIYGKSCYLGSINCINKSEFFKPLSYLLVRELMIILKEKGIEYIYLAVAANENDSYYKLYKLYQSMGFHCGPNRFKHTDYDTQPETVYAAINTSKSFLNMTNKEKTNFNTKYPMLTNKTYKYQYECGIMIGKVSHIMETLNAKINTPNSSSGGSAEVTDK